MRSILERAIEHLLNEEQDKAESLFHRFIVERARQIHESLRQGDEVALTEGWDDEIVSEEYFDDTDLNDTQVGDENVADDTENTGDELNPEGDVDAEAEPVDAEGVDVDGGEDGDVKSQLSNLKDDFEDFMDEFKEVLANLGVEDDMDAAPVDSSADASADVNSFNPSADVTESENEEVEDEDKMWENFDLDSITEAVIAELEKVSVDATTDGKTVGAGKSFTQNKNSNLPNNGVKNRVGGTPAKSPFTKNDSFSRETPPASKTTGVGKNAGNKAETFQASVKPKGDAGAALNRDFAGGAKPSKSPIAGK